MSNLNSNIYNYFDSAGVYTRGGLDSGDTAWMLTSTALVLLMTMPGLAIYYSGMVRDKNVLACKTSNIKNSTYDRLPSTNLFFRSPSLQAQCRSSPSAASLLSFG